MLRQVREQCELDLVGRVMGGEGEGKGKGEER